MNLYDIFFNICLGLFIGGIIMSVISLILAEMSTHDLQDTDHIDHVDHIDYIDHFDHVDHIDHVDHLDHIDHFDHVDHIDHVDNVDQIDHLENIDHIDHIGYIDESHDLEHLNHYSDTTPAPFMLLLSSFLLVFGISGIILYYSVIDVARVIIFFATPTIAYAATRLISYVWRKIAKSKYYNISSTLNLIGKEGEVILEVDSKGGVIKVRSDTPMKFEKMHVKPLEESKSFEKGAKVYVCDIKNGFFLVDSDRKLIKHRRAY